MIRLNDLIVQLASAIMRPLVDTFIEVAKPVVTVDFDCPFKRKIFFLKFWDFSKFDNFDAKKKRSYFLLESSNKIVQLSFEGLLEKVKSVATVQF